MKDNAALAAGWIRKGDSDLADARRTVDSDGPYDTACFHRSRPPRNISKRCSRSMASPYRARTTWKSCNACARRSFRWRSFASWT